MLYRVRVQWAGAQIVGPGVTTLFHSDTATASAIPGAVNSLFTALKALVPSGITWTIPGSGDIINPADGSLQGSWNGGADAQVTSTGVNTSYANGVGGCIDWRTGTIVGKRRARGRMFVAPMTGSVYTTGVLNSSTVSTMQTAANAYIATPSTAPVIWNRPVRNAQKVVTRVGTSSPILTATIPLTVAFLRSRKQ